MSERGEWVIDVCRFCGRIAVWPGCEHWQSGDWTVPVVVTGRWSGAQPTSPDTSVDRERE